MSEQEKYLYILDLKKYTEEDFPRLCAVHDAWSEADYKSFNYGLKILSAWRMAHDFLPAAYRYEIPKRIKILGELLNRVRSKTELRGFVMNPAKFDKDYVAFLPTAKIVDENGETKPKAIFEMPEVSGRRPEHLSQYIHKLSPALQKDAKELENLYMSLASHKERAIILSNNPNAKKEDIAHEAKETVRVESVILNFWERVDLEWEKLTGKTIDESEIKQLESEAARLNRVTVKSAGEYTKEEIDLMEDEEMRENCKKARIEANKKYLRRSDVQMTEERKEQTILRVKELLAWDIEISNRAKELLTKHKIDVPGLEIVSESEKANMDEL